MSELWLQMSLGGDWAMYDAEVAKQYPGKFVVALPNEILAVGDNEEDVRARGAEKLNMPLEDVIVVNVAPLETRVPISWM